MRLEVVRTNSPGVTISRVRVYLLARRCRDRQNDEPACNSCFQRSRRAISYEWMASPDEVTAREHNHRQHRADAQETVLAHIQ